MKKLLLIIYLFLSVTIFAAYNDSIKDITKVEDNGINLYLFYGEGCPHCKDEMAFLKRIKDKYKFNIHKYEVFNNKDNLKLYKEVKSKFKDTHMGVPYTVIGDKTFSGYSSVISEEIEDLLLEYNGGDKKGFEKKLPFLGKVDIRRVSLPLISVILGFIDGFNPCAMWVLILLISILIHFDKKKDMYIVGFTFIITSSLVYLLSMLGISFIINIAEIKIIRTLIGLASLGIGIYSLYDLRKTKEVTCKMIDPKKKKSVMARINDIKAAPNLIIMIISSIILAISVNLVELACSLGFPAIFMEILNLNKVHGISKALYLFIYILFYMIDDIIVMLLSLKALETKVISTKYEKTVKVIAALIMLVMGLLLIFKPGIIMFNL